MAYPMSDAAFARQLQRECDEAAEREREDARIAREYAAMDLRGGRGGRPPPQQPFYAPARPDDIDADARLARQMQDEFDQLRLIEASDAQLAKDTAAKEQERVEEEMRQAERCRQRLAANAGSDCTPGFTEPATAALLVVLFKSAVAAAATTAKKDHSVRMLTPYPSLPYATPPLKPSAPNYPQLQQLVQALPAVTEFDHCANINAFRQRLDAVNRDAFPLLRWVVDSNRAYIELIPKHLGIEKLATPYQYMMLIGAPEKEANFQELKAKHGVKWAFHGSSSANWHSILHNGLLNMSGSAYQLNGAVKGSGVYVATDAHESLKYSRAAPSQHVDLGRPIDPQRMVCLALCEVIANSYKDHGWCWTIENQDAIMTRMFFVYPEGAHNIPAGVCVTNSAPFVADVERTIAATRNM